MAPGPCRTRGVHRRHKAILSLHLYAGMSAGILEAGSGVPAAAGRVFRRQDQAFPQSRGGCADGGGGRVFRKPGAAMPKAGLSVPGAGAGGSGIPGAEARHAGCGKPVSVPPSHSSDGIFPRQKGSGSPLMILGEVPAEIREPRPELFLHRLVGQVQVHGGDGH